MSSATNRARLSRTPAPDINMDDDENRSILVVTPRDSNQDEPASDDSPLSDPPEDATPASQVRLVNFPRKFKGGTPTDRRDWGPSPPPSPERIVRAQANIAEYLIGVKPKNPPKTALGKVQYTGVYESDPSRYPPHTWEWDLVPALTWRRAVDSDQVAPGRATRSKFEYLTSAVDDAVAKEYTDQAKKNLRPHRGPFHPPELYSSPVRLDIVSARLQEWLDEENERDTLSRSPSSSS